MLVKLSLEAALAEAVDLHRQGANTVALKAYQNLVSQISAAGNTNHGNHKELLGRVYLGLGRLQWESGDRSDAVVSYRQAKELGQTDQDSISCLARWFFDQRNYAEVQSLLSPIANRTAEERVLLGRTFLRSGRVEEAVAELEAAVRNQPATTESGYFLACAHGWQGELTKAEHGFDQVIVLEAENAGAYLQRGLVRLKMGRVSDAKQDYEAAERLGAGVGLYTSAVLKLAVSQITANRWSEAVDTLKQLDGNDSSPAMKVDRLKLLGLSLLRANRLAELLDLDSDNDELLYYQAYGLYGAGRFDEAMLKLRRILSDQPDGKNAQRLLAATLCRLALHHAQRGQWEKVGITLEEVFAHDAERRERLEWDAALVTSTAGVFLLSGQIDEAIKIWERWQRSDVLDASAARALLIIEFCNAVQRAKPAKLRESDDAWQRVIRNAVLILHNEEFWDAWIKQCERRYQVAIDNQARREIKNRLEQELLELTSHASPAGTALRNELAAARALEQVGGFPLPEDETQYLICGPLTLRRLGYSGFFGHFVRALEDEHYHQPQELINFLRCFSGLGEAQTLLDQRMPAEALAALEGASCDACAAQISLEEKTVRVCRVDCPNFAEINPAYAGLKNKGYRLWQDGVLLAAEAHLAIADVMIASTETDAAQIAWRWSKSLHLARIAEVTKDIQQSLVNRILGHADSLKVQKRTTDAIKLLEAAYDLCPEPAREDLGGRLAELLNSRSLESANRPQPDWESAIRDFRRSVELNPYLPNRVNNLVISLRNRSGELARQSGQYQLAAQLLVEARQILEQSVGDFPDQEELIKQKNDLAGEIEAIASLLNKDGVEKVERKKFEQGLECLKLAYRLAPQVAQTGENLCEATAIYAIDLYEQGRTRLAREKVESALKDFPENESLRRAQKYVLRGW